MNQRMILILSTVLETKPQIFHKLPKKKKKDFRKKVNEEERIAEKSLVEQVSGGELVTLSLYLCLCGSLVQHSVLPQGRGVHTEPVAHQCASLVSTQVFAILTFDANPSILRKLKEELLRFVSIGAHQTTAGDVPELFISTCGRKKTTFT